MYCRNCGSQMDPDAAVCVKCGYQKGQGNQFCPHCGTQVEPGAGFCVKCGVPLSATSAAQSTMAKSRIAAGLLGIFLGGLGVHSFYLGYTGKGVAQIVLSLFCGIGAIWGFIEGIMILVGSINADANGVPLRD